MNRTVVQCSGGALYSTIWVPMVSVKSIRLGDWRGNGVRMQYCPVHHKFEKAEKIDASALSPEQRAQAESVRDLPIP